MFTTGKYPHIDIHKLQFALELYLYTTELLWNSIITIS